MVDAAPSESLDRVFGAALAGPLFVLGVCSFATNLPGRFLDLGAAIAVLVLCMNWRQTARLRVPISVIAWLALAALSVQWSAAPTATAAAAQTAVKVSLLSLAVALLATTNEEASLRSIRMSTSVLLFVALVALPGGGGEAPADSGWRSIFTHKNWCGFVAAICLLVCAHWAMTQRSWRARAAVVAAAVLVVGSQSVTALFASAVGLPALITLSRHRERSALISASKGFIVSAVSIAAALGFAYRAEVLVLFGRDPNLTGRTDLWAILLPFIGQRPWLGWGYYGFWGRQQRETQQVWLEAGWSAPSAHSAVIDTMLQLGIIGLVVLAAMCTTLLVGSLRCRSRIGPLAASLALAVLVQGVSERGVLSSTGLFLFVFGIMYVSQKDQVQTLQRPHDLVYRSGNQANGPNSVTLRWDMAGSTGMSDPLRSVYSAESGVAGPTLGRSGSEADDNCR